MLCGRSAAIDSRHPERSQVCSVRTLPICTTILEQCAKRSDSWALEVQGHLESLVAIEAVYHTNCFSQFMLQKEKGTISTVKTQGRPSNPVMQKWFEMLCQWLESKAGGELFTLSELHSKMVEFAGDSEVYIYQEIETKVAGTL